MANRQFALDAKNLMRGSLTEYDVWILMPANVLPELINYSPVFIMIRMSKFLSTFYF